MRILGRNRIVGMVIGMSLSVLSGDLLYLYHAGSWVEPNAIIRISELVSLYIFFILGLVYMVGCYISLLKQKGRWDEHTSP